MSGAIIRAAVGMLTAQEGRTMKISGLYLGMAVAGLALIAGCVAKPPPYVSGPYISGVSGPPVPGYPANAIFLEGPPTVYKFVSLNRDGALEALKSSKPGHYAIAQRLIKAAGQICAPGAPKTQAAAYQADDVSCAAGVWYESNPPKRMLNFRVGDTVYEMLVSVPL
jgi:hypothetical protein